MPSARSRRPDQMTDKVPGVMTVMRVSATHDCGGKDTCGAGRDGAGSFGSRRIRSRSAGRRCRRYDPNPVLHLRDPQTGFGHVFDRTLHAAVRYGACEYDLAAGELDSDLTGVDVRARMSRSHRSSWMR